MEGNKVFRDFLDQYKRELPLRWLDEGYKWRAIENFQQNWDIEAEDFGQMFKLATSKHVNLLASANNFPRKMILELAEYDNEATRNAFLGLFDEGLDVFERVEEFSEWANSLVLKTHGGGQHFQSENAISTYLWMMFPDKYPMYKYSEMTNFSKLLNLERIKKGRGIDNLRICFEVNRQIADILSRDEEFLKIKSELDFEGKYHDPKNLTFALDLIVFVYQKTNAPRDMGDWQDDLDKKYALTKSQWLEVFQDSEITTESAKISLAHLRAHNNDATCTQLAQKFGRSMNFYSNSFRSFGRNVAERYFGQDFLREFKNGKFFARAAMLYRYIENAGEGVVPFKIRKELIEAMAESGIDWEGYLETPDNTDAKSVNYYIVSANPQIHSFSNMLIGETVEFSKENENGNPRRVPRNFKNIKVGDLVLGFSSGSIGEIRDILQVVGVGDSGVEMKKLKEYASGISKGDLLELGGFEDGEFLTINQATLCLSSKEEYQEIVSILEEKNSNQIVNLKQEKISYDDKNFLEEVYIGEGEFLALKNLLLKKKNIILQGAPGVGKTFAAKRLAHAIMGEVDDSRIGVVQFHQSMSYEDFIEGFKPNGDNFKLESGVFKEFCRRAKDSPDQQFFFIIDEINRGNLSKIFGELMMLIENSYRGRKNSLTLAYSKESFFVPENLYIIGMMNTADRSLALIDYALRRRFAFVEIAPNLTAALEKNNFEDKKFAQKIINLVEDLNEKIARDDSLGAGFRIGHSYFCSQKGTILNQDLVEIIHFEILPILEEYWFDELEKVQFWRLKFDEVLKNAQNSPRND